MLQTCNIGASMKIETLTLRRSASKQATIDLVLIALFASLGLATKNIIHPLIATIAGPLYIPTGALAGGVYMMWYSVKGQAYRLGYAVSDDGFEWERKDDQVGIDVSPTGWDSEMIEYPSTFAWEGKLYLLYNGNGYGKTGFGLAELGSAV